MLVSMLLTINIEGHSPTMGGEEGGEIGVEVHTVEIKKAPNIMITGDMTGLHMVGIITMEGIIVNNITLNKHPYALITVFHTSEKTIHERSIIHIIHTWKGNMISTINHHIITIKLILGRPMLGVFPGNLQAPNEEQNKRLPRGVACQGKEYK